MNNLDQRGFVRPGIGAANCSIGAYEFGSRGPVHQAPAPALSPAKLFTLAALLGAMGWLCVRRRGESSR